VYHLLIGYSLGKAFTIQFFTHSRLVPNSGSCDCLLCADSTMSDHSDIRFNANGTILESIGRAPVRTDASFPWIEG